MYTIGHSTRPLDEFLGLLRAHGVIRLADVRTVPRSRRHPHFEMETLSQSLDDAGIVYRHFAALGGLRKPRADSANTAWRHAGFRGYADYMETPAFRSALHDLLAFAELPRMPQTDDSASHPPGTAIMCAEAVWWRCHRQLLADALVARGLDVRHIMSASSAPAHALSDFAAIDGDLVVYRRLI
jgi:uncharacterized protein (DUF488 family)